MLKNRTWLALVGLVFLVFAQGCAQSMYTISPIFNSFTARREKPTSAQSSIYMKNPHNRKSIQINTQSPSFQKAYEEAESDMIKRNQLIQKIVILSEGECMKYKDSVVTAHNKNNFTLGTIFNIFSALGTIFVGRATAGLSAGVFLIDGTQNLANSEFFTQNLKDVLLQAINTVRERRKGQLQRNMRMPIKQYDISTGMLELSDYHFSCSAFAGMEEMANLLKNASSNEKEAQRTKSSWFSFGKK